MAKHLEWVKLIAQAQAEKCGLTGLNRLLMEDIGRTAFITDEQGSVLSWHVPLNQSSSPQEKVLLPNLVLRSTEMTKGIIAIAGIKYFFYCWPISHQRKVGYLCVLAEDDNLSSEEMERIEFLCSAVLVEFTKREEQIELKQYLRDETLLNLLFNNSVHLESIGHLWGVNLSVTRIVFILEWKMNISGRTSSDFRFTAENFLTAKYPGVVTGMIGKCLVALFPYHMKVSEKDSQGSTGWKNIVIKVHQELQGVLGDAELWAGVGNIYSDPPSFHRSYQEAKMALEMGKLLGRGEHLAFFDELGATRLFYNQREQDLLDFFNQTLGSVLKYDQEHDVSLLSTLWQYFVSGGEVPKAIKQMYIHANTLRYRLRKVEELIGSSLDDQEVRFNVYAALKAGIMLGIIKRQEY